MSEYHHEAGKGSKQRKVDPYKYSEAWDRIFKKKEDKSEQGNTTTGTDSGCGSSCKCNSPLGRHKD